MSKKDLIIYSAVVILLIIFIPSFMKVQDLRQKNLEYEKQIEALKIKNAEISVEKKRLEEDPEYLEKVAREKMGLIREGEFVYQMTPEGE